MKGEDGTKETFNETSSVSVFFGATLGDKVYQNICADMGADVNLMDEKIFKKLLATKITSKWTSSQNL